MKKYEILAPCLVFTIKENDGQKKEYILKKGDTVDLPENENSVRALLFRKQIKETEQTVKTAKNK
jgi:hypothetical protein